MIIKFLLIPINVYIFCIYLYSFIYIYIEICIFVLYGNVTGIIFLNNFYLISNVIGVDVTSFDDIIIRLYY